MQAYTFEFKALGGRNELSFYAESADSAEHAKDAVIKYVTEFEAKYSRYRDDSMLSRINRQAGQAAVEVDQETAALIDYAQICFEQSAGLFDLSSGVLRKAWDFKQGRLPEAAQLESLLQLVGWEKVEWKKPMLRLSQPGMELDFGGIGKEYAVDQAAAILRHAGIKHGFVNFAGDVNVIGPQADGSPWKIGIVHPRKPGSVLGTLNMYKGALASSGDYERYFELDGKRYCHILNPKTGWPCSGLQAVSVLSDWCLIAGSACTIAMLLGPHKGERYIRDLGLSALMVEQNGNLKYIKMRNLDSI